MGRKTDRRGFNPDNIMAGLNPEIGENTTSSYEETSSSSKTNNDFLSTSEESTRPSIDDLVKKAESKKFQENIYLHEDVKEDLEAFGKLIGKNNGGKSFVVETALIEYFERNKQYLELAKKKKKK